MGKITGFLEIDRNERKYAPVAERLQHYREFVVPLSEKDTKDQAARCMNCGIPYCHGTGSVAPGPGLSAIGDALDMDGGEELLLVDAQQAQANHFQDGEKGDDERGAVVGLFEEIGERQPGSVREPGLEALDHLLDRNGLLLVDQVDPLPDALQHLAEGADELEEIHFHQPLGRLGVDTSLLEDMEEEHEVMANALADADAALARFAETGSSEHRDQARHAVVGAREATTRHLEHEEEQLEPLMLPHLESAEWKAAEKKLRSQPPGVAGRFFAWVEDGMGEPERAYYSSAVPAPVRFLMSRFFGRAYHREIAPVWRT